MSDKKEKGKKKGILIPALIGVVILTIIIAVIAISVKKAVSESNVVAPAAKGDRTQGRVNVQTEDVSKQSADGTISIPDTAPVVQRAKEKERIEQETAKSKGESYIQKTRVKASDSDSKVNAAAPVAQEVNELGEQIEDSEPQETEVVAQKEKSSKKAKGKNPKSDLPLPSQEDNKIDKKLNSIDSRLQETTQSARLEEQEKVEKLKNSIEKLRAERLTNASNALFSHLPYVPKTGSKYTVGVQAPKSDLYASTSTTAFTTVEGQATPTTVISGLKRSDGGQTKYGEKVVYGSQLTQTAANTATSTPTLANQAQATQQPGGGSGATIGGANGMAPAASNGTAVTAQTAKAKVQEKEVLVKAGEYIYAETTLPIDSDVPGPIRFRLLSGKAKGDIAFGTFELIEDAPGIALTVTKVIHGDEVLKTKAWTLAPDTELSLFDDDVDHHYLYRYGGLFSGLFMSGFLDSLTSATSTTTDSTTTTVTSAISNNRDRVIYSFAKAAEGFLPIFYDMANRPVQVKIPKNQEMYVLFEDELAIGGEEEVTTTPTTENTGVAPAASPPDGQVNNSTANLNTSNLTSNTSGSSSSTLKLWGSAKTSSN